MRTERVEMRHNEQRGHNPHSSGPIPSHWQIKFDGKWRRIIISTKAPFAFIHAQHTRIPVTLDPQQD